MKTLQHLAIIMDGNRRWAKKHSLSVLAGHRKAAFETIESLIKKCLELEIPYLTFWAWSTENWQRDKKEIQGVMDLLRQSLPKNFARFHEMGVKLKFLGNLSKFDKDIQKGISKWVETSKKNHKITVALALNYGGRDEILRGIKKLQNAKTPIKNLTEEKFSQFLDTAGMPDPDLIIRTGGEKRLSGFMLWQSEYSEIYFTDILFPDFGPKELEKAIQEYNRRQRRFGK